MEFFDFLRTMRGPEFLVVFGIWFVLVFGAVLLLRRWGFDNALTTLVGIALFESLGVARLATASEAGMRNFEGLFVMMFIGFWLFLVRWRSSNGGGFYVEGSDGGGCGGSGCGGGGCGGCGG
jgi:hypothetical protein